MSIFIHHIKPFELYRLLASIAPCVTKGVFILDVKRDFFNIIKSKVFSMFNTVYSSDFKKDAIQSMRRAYTIEELGWLLDIIPGFSAYSVKSLDRVFLVAEGTKE